MHIRSVIQALPVFTMSIFKFSASICEDLSQIIHNFWCEDEKNRKNTLLAWDKLTRPEGEGGMGFRDLGLFNQTLLAKQACQLLIFFRSLCAKLMKAKHYPRATFLTHFFRNQLR